MPLSKTKTVWRETFSFNKEGLTYPQLFNIYYKMAGMEMEIETPTKTPIKSSVNRSLVIETGLNNPKVLEPYSAMLNLTDVSYGVKGHNKFYQIMVIEDNSFYFYAK